MGSLLSLRRITPEEGDAPGPCAHRAPRERLAGPELLPTEGCSRGSLEMSAADHTSALPGSPANKAVLAEKKLTDQKNNLSSTGPSWRAVPETEIHDHVTPGVDTRQEGRASGHHPLCTVSQGY